MGRHKIRQDPRMRNRRETHRVNRAIRISTVRVIGANGEQLGVMSSDEARDIATNEGFDLVEVAPNARPPVCKIMDYGRFRYQQSKKASASKSAKVEIKTITLRPKTDTHDLETKVRKARAFLVKGDRVKFVMRLRGREHAHIPMWIEKFNRILKPLVDVGTITSRPRQEGRTIAAMMEPISSK